MTQTYFIFVSVSIVCYKLRAEAGVDGLCREWEEAFGREIQLKQKYNLII